MNERGQAAGVGLGSNPTFEFPPGTLEPQLWIGLKSQAFFFLWFGRSRSKARSLHEKKL